MRFLHLFFCLCAGALVACSQVPRGSHTSRLVVLDIGHSLTLPGASTPGAVNGRVLRECEFWHQYANVVKQEVRRAGYRCVIVNRGNPPTSEPFISYAKKSAITYLRHPDTNAERYPSHYFPDRVASGMVSSDYAIYNRAACVVFLHHNNSGDRWKTGASPSVILRNRYNGAELAEALRSTPRSAKSTPRRSAHLCAGGRASDRAIHAYIADHSSPLPNRSGRAGSRFIRLCGGIAPTARSRSQTPHPLIASRIAFSFAPL